ncbi:MAG: MFS transporter [Anaerolineales bacterium]
MNSLSQRFPALRERNFVLFISGHFLSLIGTAMQNTAQPLLAYYLSNSRFDLGLIGFALTLPTFFLAIPGGVLVEHLDKRKTVLVAQTVMMVQAFLLAWLTFTERVRVSHLVWLSLVLGIASTIEITARQAMLIELVGRDALPNAIALQSMAFNLSRVLGPSLATVFLLGIPGCGEAWVFLVNGVSFFFVLGGLLATRTPYRSQNQNEKSVNFSSEVREGALYLLTQPQVRRIVLLAAAMGLLAFPLVQQIPAIAREILSKPSDPRSLVDARSSAIYTAQGFGALIASLLLSVFSTMITRRERWAAVGQIAYLAGAMVIALAPPFPLALLMVALMGWGSVTQLALSNTIVQTQTPNGLRGRVFSIYLWAIQGITPLGSLLVGYLAEKRGLPFTIWFVVILCLVWMGWVKRHR